MVLLTDPGRAGLRDECIFNYIELYLKVSSRVWHTAGHAHDPHSPHQGVTPQTFSPASPLFTPLQPPRPLAVARTCQGRTHPEALVLVLLALSSWKVLPPDVCVACPFSPFKPPPGHSLHEVFLPPPA